MIAAVTQQAASGRLLFNAFDVAIVLILGFGFWRGRKNGMSKEFLPVTQWLVIIFAAGLGNELAGEKLIQWGLIKSVFGKGINENTAAYISGYLLITLLVVIIFAYLKRYLKKKLEGSNAFGAGEYYLGIAAGMIRYACMTVFALALLNAPYYTQAEISAKIAYNNRWYGGGLKGYSGDFIPSLYEVQADVFTYSLLGPYIKSGLSAFLINSVPPTGPARPAVISIH